MKPGPTSGTRSSSGSRPAHAMRSRLRCSAWTTSSWRGPLAHSLSLGDHRTWSDLAKAYEKVDQLAVLPVLTRLVERELTEADAQHYRIAARRLAKMRKLAAGTDRATDIDQLVAQLRQTHRRRPRLQQELDRAGPP